MNTQHLTSICPPAGLRRIARYFINMISATSVPTHARSPKLSLHAVPETDHALTESPKRHASLWVAACCLLWALQVTLCWVTGYRDQSLQRAVEQGVVQIESRERLNHDQGMIATRREAQRATTPFWRMLWQINDFGLEPLAFWFRLWALPMAISATALLCGRWVLPEDLRPDVARCIWPATLRPGLELITAIGNTNQASALGLNLLLPGGDYAVGPYQVLSQLDIFWLASILLTTWAMSRNHKLKYSQLFTAIGLVTMLEWLARIAVALIVGAGIRETLIPNEPFRVGRGPGP